MSDIKAQNQTALASVKAIYDAADEANTLLDGMNAAAQAAGTTLDGIYADAVQAASQAQAAQASATNASEYAARALGNLSTVQNVTETLNWITAHGTMTLTSDVALDPTHVYFVRDNNGDYHVGNYYYSVVTEPDVADIATYYELSIDESLNNYVATHLAVDSEGLWIIPDSGGNKVLIAVGGTGHTYNPAGTYVIGKVNNVDTVLASFTAGGARIGQSSDAHLDIDEDSFSMLDSHGQEFAHIGSPIGTQITDTFVFSGSSTFRLSSEPQGSLIVKINDTITTGYSRIGTSLTITAPHSNGDVITAQYETAEEIKYYTMGQRSGNAGKWSMTEGTDTEASGIGSHAEGGSTKSTGSYSHAEGNNTKAYGYGSHAEGYDTTASSNFSHAEGNHTQASEEYSHTEGYYTKAKNRGAHAEGSYNEASGEDSHAEGFYNTVSGDYSHVEGYNNEASGHYSHAQNYGTIARRNSQTAIGKWNIEDTETTVSKQKALIIGNGTSDRNRSNALTVDWDGNSEQAGHATTKDMTTQEVQDFVDDLAISGGSGTFDDGTSEAITKDDLGNVLNGIIPATYRASLISATDANGNDSDVQTIFNSIFGQMVYVTNTQSSSVASATDSFRNHYTAPTNGYLVGWVHVSYASNATGRRATRCYITTNGTRTYNNIEDIRMAVNGTATGVSLPVVVRLTTGQIFGVRVYQNSGSALTISSDLVGLFIKDL